MQIKHCYTIERRILFSKKRFKKKNQIFEITLQYVIFNNSVKSTSSIVSL